jgi:hypothetical protein
MPYLVTSLVTSLVTPRPSAHKRWRDRPTDETAVAATAEAAREAARAVVMAAAKVVVMAAAKVVAVREAVARAEGPEEARAEVMAAAVKVVVTAAEEMVVVATVVARVVAMEAARAAVKGEEMAVVLAKEISPFLRCADSFATLHRAPPWTAQRASRLLVSQVDHRAALIRHLRARPRPPRRGLLSLWSLQLHTHPWLGRLFGWADLFAGPPLIWTTERHSLIRRLRARPRPPRRGPLSLSSLQLHTHPWLGRLIGWADLFAGPPLMCALPHTRSTPSLEQIMLSRSQPHM